MATEKNQGIETARLSEYFNYPLFQADGSIDNTKQDQWNTHLLSNILGGEADTDNSWNTGNKYGDYRIWRYVTENTIPGPVDRQVNGITTGIVSKENDSY